MAAAPSEDEESKLELGRRTWWGPWAILPLVISRALCSQWSSLSMRQLRGEARVRMLSVCDVGLGGGGVPAGEHCPVWAASCGVASLGPAPSLGFDAKPKAARHAMFPSSNTHGVTHPSGASGWAGWRLRRARTRSWKVSLSTESSARDHVLGMARRMRGSGFLFGGAGGVR